MVLLTALDGAALREGLLPEIGALTSRHTVLLASVGDPRVAELAAGRGEVSAVYGAAAAAAASEGRAQLAADLRRRGVTVVDAPPGKFASVVADSYLALKSAGRL